MLNRRVTPHLTLILLVVSAAGIACRSGGSAVPTALTAAEVPGAPVLCPPTETGPAFASFPRRPLGDEVLEKSVKSMEHVGSSHIDMAMWLDLNPTPITLTLVGDYAAPHCTRHVISGFPVRETEMISFGDVRYLRRARGGWTHNDYSAPFIFDPVRIVDAVRDEVEEIELSGRQTLDGRDVFYLEGTLPPEALGETGDDFTVEIWVAFRDARFRQIRLRGEVDLGNGRDPILSGLATGKVEVRLTLKMWDFGKEVSVEPPWPAGHMVQARGASYTATLLPDGRVLVAGGLLIERGTLSSAEVYDPAAGVWTPVAAMNTPRLNPAATTLEDGRFLVWGGLASDSSAGSAEIYDPTLDLWTSVHSIPRERSYHTATLLDDGTILIAGGFWQSIARSPSVLVPQLFDPSTGRTSVTGPMLTDRAYHRATRLTNGSVLVAGGLRRPRAFEPMGKSEVFLPWRKEWTAGGDMVEPRYQHSQTLLPDGTVLVAGGRGPGGKPAGHMVQARGASYTATLLPDGRVLVAGGLLIERGTLSSAEVYDPAAGVWTPVAAMNTPRLNPAATTLEDGRFLVWGGLASDSSAGSAEIYDPTLDLWTSVHSIPRERSYHTATLLDDGTILIAGGFWQSIARSPSVLVPQLFDPSTGRTSVTGPMLTDRAYHRATRLTNGSVLVAGGLRRPRAFEPMGKSEVFLPWRKEWTAGGDMVEPRYQHSQTLLPDGTVLVAGGRGPGGKILNSAEVYDPRTNLWSRAAEMTLSRHSHTATQLRDGRVLVVGGLDAKGNHLSMVEVYDPVSRAWAVTGSLSEPRADHIAVALDNGAVLVAGGNGRIETGVGEYEFASLASAEVYDPASGSWLPAAQQ